MFNLTLLLRWYDTTRATERKATKLEEEVYIACVLMLHIVFFTFDVSGGMDAMIIY